MKGRRSVVEGQLHLSCFLKHRAGVADVPMSLVEVRKRTPQCMRLAHGLVGVHSLDCLGVCAYLLVQVTLEEVRTVVPLLHLNSA